MRLAALTLAALLAALALALHARALAASGTEAAAIATHLLQREDDAVVTGDAPALAAVFAPGAAGSLRSATNRLRYVQAWASDRGARFVGVRVAVTASGVRVSASGDQVRMRVAVSEAFTYVWDARPESPQTFGLGTRRTLALVRQDGAWRIGTQQFIDPLDQESRLPGAATPGRAVYLPAPLPEPAPSRPGYDAAGAVRYANTFCGAAPGCGNGGLYNPAYRDYNPEGGDCTNFASQILHAGGGIPEDGGWRYYAAGHGDGSLAWVRAQSLLAFVLARGRGRVLARGTFADLVRRGPDGHAAADALAPGDMIAYMERGRVVHFALVVGRDVGGYPVVDSHTADRYRVPWDLGWDRTTQFFFLRLGATAPTSTARILAAHLAAVTPSRACSG